MTETQTADDFQVVRILRVATEHAPMGERKAIDTANDLAAEHPGRAYSTSHESDPPESIWSAFATPQLREVANALQATSDKTLDPDRRAIVDGMLAEIAVEQQAR
jgi:hypothetical protein